MPDSFEIDVPLTPTQLIEQLQSCRKEMAPHIGPCNAGSDKQYFSCRVDYANSYALLSARASADGAGTRVAVDIHGSTIFAQPLGIAVTAAFLAIGLAMEAFVIHPTTTWDWLYLPVGLLIYPIGSLLLVPFSKVALKRFIQETLLCSDNS
ncbi:MAG: hypothetical protein U0105_17110 [Candidatus Obscuribacterales bacterium]